MIPTYRVPVRFEPGNTSSLLAAYVTLPAPPWHVESDPIVTVDEIRRRAAAGESSETLAASLGVSASTVQRVVRR